MGEVLNLNNVGSLYVMAPNYAAGKNMVAGVTRTFKGKIVGKDLTKWGKDAQLDFSAELAKAKASVSVPVALEAASLWKGILFLFALLIISFKRLF